MFIVFRRQSRLKNRRSRRKRSEQMHADELSKEQDRLQAHYLEKGKIRKHKPQKS